MNTKPEAMPQSVEVFDTTLRDGMQVEGVSATVDDKLRIAEQLDYLGVHYIEGGWPGSNPKDVEFFRRDPRRPPAHEHGLRPAHLLVELAGEVIERAL